jgi:RND family efflux transporter MFP subunit
MEKKELFLKRILPLLILVAGGALAYWFISTEPEPQKAAEETPGVLVETIPAKRTSEQLNVRAQGTVVPARSVTMQPQVSGRILTVNPALKPGGILQEGERMVTIDPADFKLAVSQRATELKEARARLELEQGRQSVAEEEWELFSEEFEVDGQKPELALRRPQLASVRAQVERAEAALEQARLQLKRTRIDAPFHAMVVEESAAKGQLVQPTQGIAQLVGADRFWVRVSVPPDRIPLLNIPFGESEKGSPAEVMLDLGTERIRFEGYVSRLEGRLDAQSRMAQLIVTIPDPLGALANGDGDVDEKTRPASSSPKFPLLLNAYVDVVMQGDQVNNVFVVPRTAVHGGNKVHIYDDGRLRIRSLDVVWERQGAVVARDGLKDGDLLITSRISSPVEGMRLRLARAAEAPQK